MFWLIKGDESKISVERERNAKWSNRLAMHTRKEKQEPIVLLMNDTKSSVPSSSPRTEAEQQLLESKTLQRKTGEKFTEP